MTNEQIVFNARLELMEKGVIGSTGRKIILEDENGEKKEMLEPEEIHTFMGWKEQNRQVKKGSKAIASFLIWKYTVKNPKEQEPGTEENPEENMFLTKAFWFTEAQTEPVK